MDTPALPNATAGEAALAQVRPTPRRRQPDAAPEHQGAPLDGYTATRPTLEPGKGRRFDSYA